MVNRSAENEVYSPYLDTLRLLASNNSVVAVPSEVLIALCDLTETTDIYTCEQDESPDPDLMAAVRKVRDACDRARL